MQEPKIYLFETKFSDGSGFKHIIFSFWLSDCDKKNCKDCVLENNEAVEKFDNYTKNSRKVVKY